MLEWAGGEDRNARGGKDSIRIPWEDVVAGEPDVVRGGVVCWRGRVYVWCLAVVRPLNQALGVDSWMDACVRFLTISQPHTPS